jgi:hypothetical protein
MTDAYNAGRAAGIREAAEVAKMYLWKHAGDDAYSAGMDAGARHQNAQDVSAILALLDSAPAPAGVTVQEAARLICDEVLQKPCPVAGMQRVRMINATLAVKIPSIPRAQRWAIVNAALRALSGDRT